MLTLYKSHPHVTDVEVGEGGEGFQTNVLWEDFRPRGTFLQRDGRALATSPSSFLFLGYEISDLGSTTASPQAQRQLDQSIQSEASSVIRLSQGFVIVRYFGTQFHIKEYYNF